jgi:cell wall-associated NlpC family hydrolase
MQPQRVPLGQIIDLDVEKLPLDEPPAEEGDDGAAHEATGGAIDELQALQEEAAEQEALDPEFAPDDDEVDAAEAVGINIQRFRVRVKRAALLGHTHAAEVHYTMGPRRWDGITNRCRSHLGRFPRFADCSSYATWCIWDALGGPNAGPDVVNGQFWRGGYTGTMKQNGRRLPGGIADAKIGDLVLYGAGTGKHVAIMVGTDRAISHGSEAGPHLVKPDYRPDVAEVRRYIG